jgi:hypothetical protein
MGSRKGTSEAKRQDALIALAAARARGAAGSSVDSVTASAPIVSSGGANPNIALAPNMTVTGLAPTGAALTLLPLTGLGVGTFAYVGSYGAYFSLQPVTALVPDVVLASSNAGFVWVRCLSGIAALWTAATDIYWDPQGGSNEASGLVSIAPVKTFSEIVRRYGTLAPLLAYGQSITIHLLTPQTANTDEVFFEPRLSGGGQAILLGTLVAVAAPFVGGVVTAKVRGGPGTRLQVATMPGGTVANQYVFNSTRGSYAFIDLMTGATATMQQPLAAAGLTTPNVPAPVQDNTWATGDTLATFTVPLCNLGSWNPVSADENAGATKASVGWVQWVEVADSSGNGSSSYGHTCRAVANALVGCKVSPRLNIAASTGRGQQAYVVGCTCVRAVQMLAGGCNINGGALAAGLLTQGANATVANDAYLHGTVNVTAGSSLNVTAAFGDGSWFENGGGTVVLLAAGAVWGSFPNQVQPAGTAFNNSGTTWPLAWLSSGQMSLGVSNTGSAYVGAGVMTDGIAINPANIEAGGAGGKGLFQINIAARYCSPS